MAQNVIAEYFKLFTQALDSTATPAELQNTRKIFYAGAGAAIATFDRLNSMMLDGALPNEDAEEIFEQMKQEIADFNKRLANGSA